MEENELTVTAAGVCGDEPGAPNSVGQRTTGTAAMCTDAAIDEATRPHADDTAAKTTMTKPSASRRTTPRSLPSPSSGSA